VREGSPSTSIGWAMAATGSISSHRGSSSSNSSRRSAPRGERIGAGYQFFGRDYQAERRATVLADRHGSRSTFREALRHPRQSDPCRQGAQCPSAPGAGHVGRCRCRGRRVHRPLGWQGSHRFAAPRLSHHRSHRRHHFADAGAYRGQFSEGWRELASFWPGLSSGAARPSPTFAGMNQKTANVDNRVSWRSAVLIIVGLSLAGWGVLSQSFHSL